MLVTSASWARRNGEGSKDLMNDTIRAWSWKTSLFLWSQPQIDSYSMINYYWTTTNWCEASQGGNTLLTLISLKEAIKSSNSLVAGDAEGPTYVRWIFLSTVIRVFPSTSSLSKTNHIHGVINTIQPSRTIKLRLFCPFTEKVRHSRQPYDRYKLHEWNIEINTPQTLKKPPVVSILSFIGDSMPKQAHTHT